MSNKLKVATVVGTRPEIIRLSRVIPALDKFCDHVLIHTGQNYDYELNEVFFNELQIRQPDHYLNCSKDSFGKTVGSIIANSEEVFLKEKPDALLILGDTNSSLVAYTAKRLKIPIYHMEAGNRSFDLNVPEEINRKIVDHISDFNLVYTEHARRHLLSENIPHRHIYKTGSPLREVLNYYKLYIEKSVALNQLNLKAKEYFLVSIHREENVDNEENLNTILEILNDLQVFYDVPVIVSTHPRTKNRLKKIGYEKINDQILFLKPFGFFDYVRLQQCAKCVISDSGSISEEAAILDFPAVTIRNSMERPEAVDTGSIIITGLNYDTIVSSVNIVSEYHHKFTCPEDYKIDNSSEIVVKLIIGTAKLSNRWQGIQVNQLTRK